MLFVWFYLTHDITSWSRIRCHIFCYPRVILSCPRQYPSFLYNLGVCDTVFSGAKTAFWMLTDYRAINVKEKLLTFPNYDTLDWEECTAFMSNDYLNLFFKTCEKLQNFQFTDEERCLFQAIVILQPGIIIRLFQFLFLFPICQQIWVPKYENKYTNPAYKQS